MQRREDNTGNDQRDLDGPDQAQRCLHVKTFKDIGAELQGQDGGVEQHAPTDLEEGRMRVPVDDDVPDAPGLPQVYHQSEDDHQVAQEGGQDGRADDGVVLLEAEDVHRRCQSEATSSQGHPAVEVEGNPQPPGAPVAQIADGADAIDPANNRHHQPDGHQDP